LVSAAFCRAIENHTPFFLDILDGADTMTVASPDLSTRSGGAPQKKTVQELDGKAGVLPMYPDGAYRLVGGTA
jgi:hypothetical protein